MEYRDEPMLSFRPIDAKESKPKNVRRLVRLHSLIRFAAVALIATFLLLGFVIRPIRVRSDAPSVSLSSGSVVFVTPLQRSLKCGKIVAFTSPSDRTGKICVRRIVAVGGQTVAIKDGVLLLDGEPANEPHLSSGEAYPDVKETTVPDGYVCVLEDGARDATDSRDALGIVDARSILGVVCFSIGN